PVAARLIEGAGGRVRGPSGRLHDDEAGEAGEAVLHGMQKGGADPGALQRGVDRHPVEIVGAEGARSGAPADPAGQAAVVLGAEREIIGRATDRAVEYLEG